MPPDSFDSRHVCEWCELPIDSGERVVRLSNTQPPWSVHQAYSTARMVAAAGNAFASALRAATMAEEPITLFFHPACWRKFVGLLRAGRGE